jgi:hypothetical protein
MKIFNHFFPSDITVKFAGQKLRAHKFIMAARSDFWSNRDLNELSDLELTGMEFDEMLVKFRRLRRPKRQIKLRIFVLLVDISAEVGLALMRWVYTDKAEIRNEENFLVDLVKGANRYKLTELRGR